MDIETADAKIDSAIILAQFADAQEYLLVIFLTHLYY